MRLKKVFCMLMACAAAVSCLCISAGAVGAEKQEEMMIVARATGKFNIDVPAKEIVSANISFPLEVGETVTIKASYSPFSASIDFGLTMPRSVTK